jgi:hypothetical protein
MISDDDEEADSLDFTKLVDSHLPDADDDGRIIKSQEAKT